MSTFENACLPDQRLSKNTLLAMLPSSLDTTKGIIKETGEIIDLTNLSENVIKTNIKNKVWVYYEELLPRRMLLTNPNWTITSFNPKRRNVCVIISTNSGDRVLNFTLPELTANFH